MQVKEYKTDCCGVTARISTIGNSKYVDICSRIHVKPEYRLPHSYAITWSDYKILRDSDFLKYLSRYR